MSLVQLIARYDSQEKSDKRKNTVPIFYPHSMKNLIDLALHPGHLTDTQLLYVLLIA